jgi:hypothetical protein
MALRVLRLVGDTDLCCTELILHRNNTTCFIVSAIRTVHHNVVNFSGIAYVHGAEVHTALPLNARRQYVGR